MTGLAIRHRPRRRQWSSLLVQAAGAAALGWQALILAQSVLALAARWPAERETVTAPASELALAVLPTAIAAIFFIVLMPLTILGAVRRRLLRREPTTASLLLLFLVGAGQLCLFALVSLGIPELVWERALLMVVPFVGLIGTVCTLIVESRRYVVGDR